MAQNVRIAALTDELIQAIVGFNPETNKRAYKHARDIAAKGLRAHQYNRTNQFEVQRAFEGLDEKFRVQNRDDLANALRSRLNELKGVRNKWIPEYLSLLLQLADRPTENSEVAALELLRPPTPPPPLTWEEILRDDSYSDEEIWRDIDYAAESSEEEGIIKRVEKKKRKESPPSSIDEGDAYSLDSYVIPIDRQLLDDITKAQYWKAQPHAETGEIEITELQAIRETLFMLAGLRTSLYVSDTSHGNVRVNQRYTFSHAIPKTINHLLAQFATIGRDLNRLRQWTRRPSSLPLVQTFEAAVRRRLTDYDRSLASLQQEYLTPKESKAVSLLALHTSIQELSAPLLRLSQLVSDVEPQLLVNPFAHLETLFQQISLAQTTLEINIFDYFSDLFFECLQTYLKPIRKWMEAGELGSNDETFFVFENDSGSESSSLWHDRYVLRRGKGNALRSPAFLEPAAMKIFNSGKSVVFLKELGIYDDMTRSGEAEPRLDRVTVCRTAGLPLSPFSELFQAAFDGWINSKYSLASTVLRSYLFEQCGLLRVLENFHIIYLGVNGAVFQDLANAIFERMDSKRRGWNDRFLLTEMARGVFGSVLGRAATDGIIVRSVRTRTQTRSVKGLATLSIDYALPWSIANIIQRSSLPIYQQILTLLLQTYRAKYLLQALDTRAMDNLDPKHRNKSFRLRNQLLVFTDLLRSYLTETIIARGHAEMLAAMSKAADIDEMAGIHVKFLARLQEQALLSENLKMIHGAVISVLDLAVLFHDAHERRTREGGLALKQSQVHNGKKTVKTKTKPKLKKRKSIIPALVETLDDDSPTEAEEVEESEDRPSNPMPSKPPSFEGDLCTVDKELGRLLPFLRDGLRNIGRVGGEPAWEMLAERLEWGNGKAGEGALP
ncbi:uncharacterized protein EI97DRAFT_410650 [Westerdykella ornata]|uniref:Spindle pole body component n=1 Tax=Westerdykella ornata TaxID=318751 RepID=A0A6A6JUD9_WESOR|nr:uncharacterized protein EI97DRAFT_410650 [Westerdykella ornata]KAF2279865.1 hypothetical protein EI97DRAFT_410650 [Westerdykella ornata]